MNSMLLRQIEGMGLIGRGECMERPYNKKIVGHNLASQEHFE